jgi:hypothetical protein
MTRTLSRNSIIGVPIFIQKEKKLNIGPPIIEGPIFILNFFLNIGPPIIEFVTPLGKITCTCRDVLVSAISLLF